MLSSVFYPILKSPVGVLSADPLEDPCFSLKHTAPQKGRCRSHPGKQHFRSSQTDHQSTAIHDKPGDCTGRNGGCHVVAGPNRGRPRRRTAFLCTITCTSSCIWIGRPGATFLPLRRAALGNFSTQPRRTTTRQPALSVQRSTGPSQKQRAAPAAASNPPAWNAAKKPDRPGPASTAQHRRRRLRTTASATRRFFVFFLRPRPRPHARPLDPHHDRPRRRRRTPRSASPHVRFVLLDAARGGCPFLRRGRVRTACWRDLVLTRG